jgi:uncharacterized protein
VERVRVGVRVSVCCIFCALPVGCGSAHEAAPARTSVPPRLTFGYDAKLPLQYENRGRINARADPVAVDDVSFRSERQRIDGYLVLPPNSGRHPAVVVVHGSGGDRSELLDQARRLAARDVVALTITEPSTSSPLRRPRGGLAATLQTLRTGQVTDVVAIRRAVDVLTSLPEVDRTRIGYLGWSAGARAGTFIAASEPRIKALVLLSAGAAPISAYVAAAPAGLRGVVRKTLGSVDPLRYIAVARPGSILLEDGEKDEIVPRSALLNIVRAAPKGTTVRWYEAPHALDQAAYDDAFAWLTRKLRNG